MKRFSILLIITFIMTGCHKKATNSNYSINRPPLADNAYVKLPLGSIRAQGWLNAQLSVQADGLTGNLDDFWPDLTSSAWTGGTGDAWERGPYFLDGLVPLAYILDDARLKDKVAKWIEPILKSSTGSGWFGPPANKDRWPLAVAAKAVMQYYEATGDARATELLRGWFRYINENPPDWPEKEWRGVRAMENAVSGYWLFRQTGEPWILDAIASIQGNSPDWTAYYEKFPWDLAASDSNKIPRDHTAHVVNNAMAIKYPGLWYQQSKDERFRKAVMDGIEKYDINHGQAGGRFSGDEHLSGTSPDSGTEMCGIVEYMFSLGELYAVLGENSLADRLEMLAYNALPGTTTPDMWAHQYDQQSNQVLVTNQKRNWVSNGDESNIYGFSPNYGCCLANMHQGWPKFVQNTWMATNDNGLAAVLYAPTKVTAMVGRGRKVTIEEETSYPFDGTVKLTIRTLKPCRFPLHLRIPGWADSVPVIFRGKKTIVTGRSHVINVRWNDGDVVKMEIPMHLRTGRRYNNSVAVMRGPLFFSLRIGKQFTPVKLKNDNYGYKGSIDWEIRPSTGWNYGLLLDERNVNRGMKVTVNEPGKYPFADEGDMVWSDDSARYVRWQDEAPVVITARGMKIPGWGMSDNSAALPPQSPVSPQGDPEIIRLVPYGCARLRITEFPVMDVTLMQEVMREGR